MLNFAQADIDRDKEALRLERNRAKREREVFKIQMAALSTALEQSKKAIADLSNVNYKELLIKSYYLYFQTPKIDPLEQKLKTQAARSTFQITQFFHALLLLFVKSVNNGHFILIFFVSYYFISIFQLSEFIAARKVL